MYTPRSGQMLDNSNIAPCFVTTNSFVKQSGDLVMGRGAAAAASRIWPEAPAYFGHRITSANLHMKRYGILYSPKMLLGIFQVKYFWGDDASLDLIKYSAEQLAEWASIDPGQTIHLNYPGIGFGRLSKSAIDPLLEVLPPSVHVWTFSGPSLSKG